MSTNNQLFNGYPSCYGSKPQTWRGWFKSWTMATDGRVMQWTGSNGKLVHQAHVANDGHIQSTVQSYVNPVLHDGHPEFMPLPKSRVEKNWKTGFCYLTPIDTAVAHHALDPHTFLEVPEASTPLSIPSNLNAAH